MPSILNATTTNGLVTSADNSGSLQLQTNNGTTAVTIDTSQNVGIGTTSPETKLHVTQSNDALPALQLRHGDGDFILMEEGGGTDLFKFTRVAATNDLQINNVTANNIRFATNNTERMRITSDGFINCTAANFAGQLGTASSYGYLSNSNSTSFLQFNGSSNASPYIIYARANTGGVQLNNGATAWSATSDARLKNVTGTYSNPLADIAQIQPVKFTWKDDADNKPQVGVLAQSVLPVVPEAIDSQKLVRSEDETEYLSVRYTELIPLMIASIQELKAELDATKAEVQALKGVA